MTNSLDALLKPAVFTKSETIQAIEDTKRTRLELIETLGFERWNEELATWAGRVQTKYGEPGACEYVLFHILIGSTPPASVSEDKLDFEELEFSARSFIDALKKRINEEKT